MSRMPLVITTCQDALNLSDKKRLACWEVSGDLDTLRGRRGTGRWRAKEEKRVRMLNERN